MLASVRTRVVSWKPAAEASVRLRALWSWNLAALNHLLALEPSHDSRHYPNGSDALDSRSEGVKIDCSRDRCMKFHQDDEFKSSLAKHAIVALLILCAFAVTAAAKTSPRTDALGAHVNAGRGCPECHAPHRTSCGERNTLTRKASQGGDMLWGQDVTSTYAVYGNPDHSTPNDSSDIAGILKCLSCHDGNYGPQAMMRNVFYETIPSTYGSVGTAPTLMDQESLIAGHEIEDHPIGLEARIKCGGALGWDCTENNGVITMGGIHSSHLPPAMVSSSNQATTATLPSLHAPRATIPT